MDAAVLAALDSIAWTFNVRGADVSHTPVALAYALVHADGTADLFVEGEKVAEEGTGNVGARHRSAYRLAGALPGSVAVVISRLLRSRSTRSKRDATFATRPGSPTRSTNSASSPRSSATWYWRPAVAGASAWERSVKHASWLRWARRTPEYRNGRF